MEYILIENPGGVIGLAESDKLAAWFAENANGDGSALTTREVTEIDCHDVSYILQAIATRAGISAQFDFVPLSQSRNAGTWESLNWKAKLSRNGREFLVTDYAQGIGHTPAAKLKGGLNLTINHKIALAECESGKICRENLLGGSVAARATTKPIPAPHFGDVLHSLILESDVLDAGGFESWASEFGYDTDSRKAESLYRQCLETALAMRSALGESLMAEMRLVAQFN